MEIISLFIVFGLCVLGLYLARELVCWYFKINERIKLQKELGKLLVKLLTNSNGTSAGSNKD